MSDTPKKHRAHILTSFKDAGTGESFKPGETPLIEIGSYANYEAAGLLRAHDTGDSRASDPASGLKPPANK